MFWLQGDQDVPVGGRHERRVAEGQVDAPGGKADVVQHGVDLVGGDGLADHVFDIGEAARALLQARAVRAADVQPELPRVDRREEVHADQPEEPQGERHEAREDTGHDAPVSERPREERAVPVPQALEAAVERLVHGPDAPRIGDGVLRVRGVQVCLGGEQVAHHGRDDGAGEQVAREHREDDGLGERREEVLRDARDEHDRDEHDADAERRDEGRGRDLLRAVEDRLDHRLSHREVAVRVLDLDRRVVDEDADGKRQATERHHVECLAEERQRDHRDQDGERDRHHDHQRRAPRAEEEEDHEPGERSRDDGFAQDALQRRPHEHRLVEERLDLELRGKRGLDAGQGVLHALDDVEGRGGGRLQHREQRR